MFRLLEATCFRGLRTQPSQGGTVSAHSLFFGIHFSPLRIPLIRLLVLFLAAVFLSVQIDLLYTVSRDCNETHYGFLFVNGGGRFRRNEKSLIFYVISMVSQNLG